MEEVSQAEAKANKRDGESRERFAQSEGIMGANIFRKDYERLKPSRERSWIIFPDRGHYL